MIVKSDSLKHFKLFSYKRKTQYGNMNNDFIYENSPSYYKVEEYIKGEFIHYPNEFNVDYTFDVGNGKEWKILVEPVKETKQYQPPLDEIVDERIEFESGELILTNNNEIYVGDGWIYDIVKSAVYYTDPSPSILPMAMKVASQTMSLNLVSVKPLAQPSGQLMYVDYKYQPEASVQHLEIPITISPSSQTDNIKKKPNLIKRFFNKLIKKAKDLF
jgi:hypothetical protein